MMVLLDAAKIHYRWQAPTIQRFDEPPKLILGESFYKTYHPDFSINDSNILVEIDGKAHDKHEDYDATRDAYLVKRGWKVLRFSNANVIHEGEKVISAIQIELTRKGLDHD